MDSPPQGPLPNCFVCDLPVDRAGLESVLTAVACLECKARAQLASTGAQLTTVLDSVRPYPLEGSGLNAVLNPLLVEGQRAWADFMGGGFAVFLELKPSSDCFDFVMQHVTPWPQTLLSLRERGVVDDLVFADLLPNVRTLAEQLGAGLAHPLDRLLLLWQMARAGERALATVGPIHNKDDAWAVAEAVSLPRGPIPKAVTDGMVARLAKLAGAA